MVRAMIKKGEGYEEKYLNKSQLADWLKKNSDDTGKVTSEIKLYSDCKVLPLGGGEDGFEFVFSDYTVDRDQERIAPEGWELNNYVKNPVILWGHDHSRPSIGRSENVRVSDGALRGKVVFDLDDPFAAMINGKVKNGFLTSGSVGFIPLVIEIVDDKDRPEWYVHKEQELIEFSIVNVPCNPNATREVHLDGDTQKGISEGIAEEIKQGLPWFKKDKYKLSGDNRDTTGDKKAGWLKNIGGNNGKI